MTIGNYGVLLIEVSGAQADRVDVVGNLYLSSALDMLAISGTLSGTTSYVIASYTGTLTGTFNTIPSIPTPYRLDYGTGSNSVISLMIPEPSTALVLALGALALRRRRG